MPYILSTTYCAKYKTIIFIIITVVIIESSIKLNLIAMITQDYYLDATLSVQIILAGIVALLFFASKLQ